MDIFEEEYYCINKRMLCIIGQWPYQSILERSVRTLIVLVVIASLVTPQVIKLPQIWSEMNLVIETIASFFTNGVCVTKLLNCILNTRKMRRLLDETRRDWKYMRFMPEMEILQEYGKKGRRLTILYIIFLYTVLAAWISIPLAPIIMDLVLPLNESRGHIVLFQTDYKIDPNKYFFALYVHGSFSSCVSILIIAAVDTLYMSISQHACAMLRIMRYHLENINRENEKLSVKLNPNLREDQDFHQIVYCIEEHKHAIEYIRSIESSCEWSLFLIIGFNMFLMSVTGARTVSKTSHKNDVIRFGVFTLSQMIHLYCNSLPGQWIMDSSSKIPNSAYNCKWYFMSVRSRKLLVLLIRRSVQPCTITAGKLYVMSKENFCAVLQTSMSYFTLLTSLQ